MHDLPMGRVGVSSGRRREAKRIKVITDGLKTEFGYFTRLNQLSIDIVEPLARRGFSLDDMLSEAKKIKESGADYDEVCIAVDIDERLDSKRGRQNLEKFLETAREAGVPVYLSNESFEVWLLAHAISVPKRAGKRGEATRMALKQGLLDGRRKKEVVADAISVKSVQKALLEIRRLRKEYGEDVLRVKPMTDVDKMVEKIELLG